MVSLTSFLPMLVSHLGITKAAIYERQRALIRLGLLPKPVGRGRGSGAEATPLNASLIILSALATENLSDMDDRIVQLSRAPVTEWRKKKECRLTKQTVFSSALAEMLAHPDLAKRVSSVRVKRRGSLEATIYWYQKIPGKLALSTFGEDDETKAQESPSLKVDAYLDGIALQNIAALLAGKWPNEGKQT
jgi:hypothetical protein